MTPDFIENPAYEIARRIELRDPVSYSWFVVLRRTESAIQTTDLLNELEAFDLPAQHIDTAGMHVDELRSVLQSNPKGPALLSGFDDRSPDFWASMDVNRSAFERPGSVILWMSPAAATAMCQFAPNIRSYVGGSIFHVGADHSRMTAEERERRLKELRSFYHLTDEEVIELATQRRLNPDPQFVEWLALLGRGELI